jgi:hypothetical protein
VAFAGVRLPPGAFGVAGFERRSAHVMKEKARCPYFLDTMDTIYGFSGKYYQNIVQKKDYGNGKNGVHGARRDGVRELPGGNTLTERTDTLIT